MANVLLDWHHGHSVVLDDTQGYQSPFTLVDGMLVPRLQDEVASVASALVGGCDPIPSREAFTATLRQWKADTPVSRVILDHLNNHTVQIKATGLRKFVQMWQFSHARCPKQQIMPQAVQIVLDSLEAIEPQLRHICRSWLVAERSSHLPHIMDPLLLELFLSDGTYTWKERGGLPTQSNGTFNLTRTYEQPCDASKVVYLFSLLTNLLQAEASNILLAAASSPISDVAVLANWYSSIGYYLTQQQTASSKSAYLIANYFDDIGFADDRGVLDYLDLLCVVSLRFIDTEVRQDLQDALTLSVRSAAAEFLRTLLETLESAPALAQRCNEAHRLLAPPLLGALASAVDDGDTVILVQIMDILRLVLPTVLDHSTEHRASAPAVHSSIDSQSEDKDLSPTTFAEIRAFASRSRTRQLMRSSSISTMKRLLPLLLSIIAQTTVGWSADPETFLNLESSPSCNEATVCPVRFDSATFMRSMEFALLIGNHISPAHRFYEEFWHDLLSQLTRLVCRVHIAAPSGQTAAYLDCLVRALEKLLLCVLYPPPGMPQDAVVDTPPRRHELQGKQPGRSSGGSWFGNMWSSGTPVYISLYPPVAETKRTRVLRFFTPKISLTALRLVQRHPQVPDGDHTKSNSVSDPTSNRWISIFASLRRMVGAVIQHMPQAVVATLLQLMDMAEHAPWPTHQQVGQLLSFIESISIRPYPLVTLMPYVAEALSFALAAGRCHIEGELPVETPRVSLPQRLSNALESGFIPKESQIYHLLCLWIEQLPTNAHADAEPIWTQMCLFLSSTLADRQHSLAAAWQLSLLQRLDAVMPSRTTFLQAQSRRWQSLADELFARFSASTTRQTPPRPNSSHEEQRDQRSSPGNTYVRDGIICHPLPLHAASLLAAIQPPLCSLHAIATKGTKFQSPTHTRFLLKAPMPNTKLFLGSGVLQAGDVSKLPTLVDDGDQRPPERDGTDYGCSCNEVKQYHPLLGRTFISQKLQLQQCCCVCTSSGSIGRVQDDRLSSSAAPLGFIYGKGSANFATLLTEGKREVDTCFMRQSLLLPATNSESGWIVNNSRLKEDADLVNFEAHISACAILAYVLQIELTQRRTALSGILVPQITDLVSKTLLPATLLRIWSPEAEGTLMRFLVLSLVGHFPATLFPWSLTRRVVADFVTAPAYGSGASSTNLFLRISPSPTRHLHGIDRRTFRCLCVLVNRAVEEDADDKLFASTLAAHTSSVFISRESDIKSKRAELRRLTYFIIACSSERFKAKATEIMTKAQEGFEAADFETNILSPAQLELRSDTLLLLRAMLWKLPPDTLQILWTALFSEIARLFGVATNLLKTPDCLTDHGLRFLLYLLKLLDVAMLVDIPQWLMHQWVFVREAAVMDTKEKTAASYMLSGKVEEEPLSEAVSSNMFKPWCQQLTALAERATSPDSTASVIPLGVHIPHCGDEHVVGPIITCRKAATLRQIQYLAKLLTSRRVWCTSAFASTVLDDRILCSIEDDLLDERAEFCDWTASTPVF